MKREERGWPCVCTTQVHEMVYDVSLTQQQILPHSLNKIHLYTLSFFSLATCSHMYSFTHILVPTHSLTNALTLPHEKVTSPGERGGKRKGEGERWRKAEGVDERERERERE